MALPGAAAAAVCKPVNCDMTHSAMTTVSTTLRGPLAVFFGSDTDWSLRTGRERVYGRMKQGRN